MFIKNLDITSNLKYISYRSVTTDNLYYNYFLNCCVRMDGGENMHKNLKRYKVLNLMIFVLIMSFSGCAWIPLWSDDESEVELESDFEEFEAIEAETPLEIEELQEEVRVLRSQQENAEFKIEELENTISSLVPRLRELEEEKQEDSNSSQIEELKSTVEAFEAEIERLEDDVAKIEFEMMPRNPPKALSKKSVRKDYDEAIRLYNIKQYDESLYLFGKLDNNRTPIDLRDNVYFWMGQCYFMLGDFANATEKFNVVIEKYKKGNKLFDAMYMLGATYNEVGEKSKALNQLEKTLNNGPPFEIRKKIEGKIKEIES